MSELFQVAAFAVTLAIVLLFGRVVFDLIQVFARHWRPTGLALVVANLVYGVTDPPMKALGKVIKPVRAGGISLDLAFLVLLLGLYLLQGLFLRLAAAAA